MAVVLPPPESPLLTRELLYTAVTRAREHVRILGTPESVRAAVEPTGGPGERPVASRPAAMSPTPRSRCIQATSCQRSCFQPMRRKVPTGTNPKALCRATLASLGSAITATAVR